MKRVVLVFLCFFCIGLSADAQDVKTGLKLASPDQLRGVPLAFTPFSGDELKPVVDLSANLPPAGNQGQQNSCVGWAVAYCVKSYQEKVEQNHAFTDWSGNLDKSKVFSPAYIYNQINNGQDGGSYIIDALNILSNKGAVTLADMPYSDSDYLTKPNTNHHAKAKTFKINFWRQVNVRDIKEVKAQLQAGYPVVIGAEVDNGFIRDAINNPNYVWTSHVGNAGGHAMAIVGYSDYKKAFRVMNSWGQNWGDKGLGWISYSLFPQVVSEGYVMKDAINGPSTEQPLVDNNNNTNTNPNTDWQNIELTDPEDLFVDNTEYDNDQWDNYDPGFLNAQLAVTNVQFDIWDQSFNYGENGMRFDGTVYIPPRAGQNFQIVVYFYYNDGYGGKGQQVGSTSYTFRDIQGFAATYTPQTNLSPQGANLTWWANLPYPALNIQRGYWDYGVYYPYRSLLIAEPVLFIDNFPVSYGQLNQFWVEL
ncbi:MAG: C1 family peptidase [Bacteroidota bacterium]